MKHFTGDFLLAISRRTELNIINVGGVEQFSLVDFPGKVAASVFMQGCPWRCPFCHNADLQIVGKDTHFIWDKFIEFLKTRRGLLDAVVFSGGEPLLQDTLPEAIKEVKELGFIIGLHTGGYRPSLFKQVLPLVDWVGFDIKAPFEVDRYQQAVGGANHLHHVLESLDMLIASGVEFECRTTCDPRILEVEDILAIAKSLQEKGVKNYYLQKYRPIPSDTTTTDADCEKFFDSLDLIKWLRENFANFDIRK